MHKIYISKTNDDALIVSGFDIFKWTSYPKAAHMAADSAFSWSYGPGVSDLFGHVMNTSETPISELSKERLAWFSQVCHKDWRQGET